MKVVNEIDDIQCGTILNDADRVKYIENASLIGSGSEDALDRLTFLASKLLDVPLTIVSFVGDKSQYFKSFHGLPEPWCTEREIPIDVSVCQYTLIGDILSLNDVREHPLLANNPAVPALNLVGYLGVPLLTKQGHNLGAFCAVSDQVREWSADDIEILKTLTQSAMSEIELNIALEQQKKEKDDWEKTVSMLLHDLRGPLGTIKGWAEFSQSVDDKNLQEEALRSISKCSDDGIKIVDNILNWKLSNLNNNKKLKKENFVLNDYLSYYLKEVVKLKQIEINHNLNENQFNVFGHKDSIFRAITNLIQNAIKYGDTSRPITLKVHEDDSQLNVSVHNFGNPISEEEISNIFEFSSRGSSLASLSSEGWGIGLHLVNSVAKAHNGKISVKSDEQNGTEFELRLSHNQ
ncbi:MAG: hypothetical protein CME62_09385 [Halobacteriovoraceae bacterium]|nr:hypothetical protein [Halobacteriovoraceae bacterium]